MKIIIYSILLIALFTAINRAQLNNLLKLKSKYEMKVSVGSSPEEVKKILGKPKTIESGFPKTDEILPLEFPEQVGQLNNSTWFYFLPIQKIVHDAPEESICYINGFKVDQDTYDSYINHDSIYFYLGEPTPIQMAEGYKVLKDPSLKLVKKEASTTSKKILKRRKVTTSFVPILCIIFDRGTQVVASTQVFFQMVSK